MTTVQNPPFVISRHGVVIVIKDNYIYKDGDKPVSQNELPARALPAPHLQANQIWAQAFTCSSNGVTKNGIWDEKAQKPTAREDTRPIYTI
jgi:hypothetical protein